MIAIRRASFSDRRLLSIRSREAHLYSHQAQVSLFSHHQRMSLAPVCRSGRARHCATRRPSATRSGRFGARPWARR
eukprot:2033973-Pleurochrysis_carterae.AAC.1